VHSTKPGRKTAFETFLDIARLLVAGSFCFWAVFALIMSIAIWSGSSAASRTTPSSHHDGLPHVHREAAPSREFVLTK
jgi:hypothetical protein